MSYANNKDSGLFSQSLIPFSPYCTARTCTTTLKRNGDDKGHPCNGHDLKGKAFNSSPLNMMAVNF